MMPKKIIFEEGTRFGKLVVVREAEKMYGKTAYLMKCDCGKECVASASHLKNGQRNSCGCYKIKHAYVGTPTYTSWQSMKQRCSNSKNSGYYLYGGRGVTYDPRWNDFMEFLADMGERPPNTTLDKDIKGGVGCDYYCKENCMWATATQQQSHRRGALTNEQRLYIKSLWESGMGISQMMKITQFNCHTLYKYRPDKDRKLFEHGLAN